MTRHTCQFVHAPSGVLAIIVADRVDVVPAVAEVKQWPRGSKTKSTSARPNPAGWYQPPQRADQVLLEVDRTHSIDDL